MRKLLLISLVVVVAVLLSGCTCCNLNTSFNTGTVSDSFTLNSQTYKDDDIGLNADQVLTYSVSTSAAPVDVYILDEQNYNLYIAHSDDWEALVSETIDENTSGEFTAPSKGTYYFVVENPGDKSTKVTWNLKW